MATLCNGGHIKLTVQYLHYAEKYENIKNINKN